MLILGIDDAGRGPLIGPMVLAGVLLKREDEKFLKNKGVDDSKVLEHKKRIELAKIIEEKAVDFETVVSSPIEIDEAVNGINLNTLEAKKAADIINIIKKDHKNDKIMVIIDCPSVNTDAWKLTLLRFVDSGENLEIFCEHKADANHVSVSAASILAKVEREKQVDIIRQKYGDFGSGYPSDPYTKEFLSKNGAKLKNSGIFRKTWSTWKKLFPDNKQSTLEGFK
jgi:ribonuclease HII